MARQFKQKLDEYEQDLEDNLERGSDYSETKAKKRMKELQQLAVEHNARKQISIRIIENDIPKLRSLAEEEGLQYQTFITSVLHKVAIGKLRI
tara:strand:- start:18204 stop:18482 length:279 start_codon:yes stop_codon:yes gene_type:complete